MYHTQHPCRFISAPIAELIELAGVGPKELVRAIAPDPSGDYCGDIPSQHTILDRISVSTGLNVGRIYQVGEHLYTNISKLDTSDWIRPHWRYCDMFVHAAHLVCKANGDYPASILAGLSGKRSRELIETMTAIGGLNIMGARGVGGVTIHAELEPQWVPLSE